MHDNGIGVVLATPTSSPPPWMGRLHPDTLPVTEDGRTEWWGGRQHFAHSSATYRRYAAAITEDLAARDGDHPALTMWHINNEYCTFDYGDEAAAASARWLREKVTAPSPPSTRPGAPPSGARATTPGTEILPAPPAALHAQPRPGPGLQALHLRHALECYTRRAGHRPPAHPAHPGHQQLHAAVGRAGRLALGRAGGRRLRRPLPRPARPARAPRTAPWSRT